MNPQQQGVSAHEFAGAIGGTLDTATGNQLPAIPAHCTLAFKPTSAQRGRQFKGKNAGCLYYVVEGEVTESNNAALPVGAKTKVFVGGLDSRMNNGSLAASAQADLRALLEAMCGMAPGSAPPTIQPSPQNPNPGTGWAAVASLFVEHPEYTANLRPFKIVSGAAKGEYVPKQFYVIG